MNRLLAIDSATDALSLALADERGCESLHRVMPRQHQQLLFSLLDELLHGRKLSELNLQAIVYGRGPGSFTGLRIAVSAAQGLAFSLKIPVIGVSSLETQVRTLLRTEPGVGPSRILSCIDARIGQVYGQWFDWDGSVLISRGEAFVAVPEAIEQPNGADTQHSSLLGVGSGLRFLEAMPETIRGQATCWPEVLPEARDMFLTAAQALEAGEVQDPMFAAPDYVQTRIGWKTLAEQGRVA
ncbi:tRNA (adenosine(37)-N6)-threonylcarbamoyltransferase complex dimerization subunit type 1 TsaB [Congregibacter variabilis]|uniref:tRNA threonylcarbamoyladenosine biosynthesis protein TsaB n=1 Tax=Congregibacter variabilis TaxID=3081200 RepID=A0ABZ0I346_9GAMM|nr:tRNA (adenosine(37)-N6)-threonylcarbamoyltransferase complex dimerization subunit type 1 TsaB [Congregibacter sp. IMCC43200]